MSEIELPSTSLTDTKTSKDIQLNTEFDKKPPKPKESAIEKLAREVQGAGFKIITHDEYNRLAKKESWWSIFFKKEAQRAVWNLLITIIIAIAGLFYAHTITSIKSSVDKSITDQIDKKFTEYKNSKNSSTKIS